MTQAVKLSELDNGDLGGWDLAMGNKDLNNFNTEASKKFAQTYFTPYLKYSYICDNTKPYCSQTRKSLKGSNDPFVQLENNLYGVVLQNGVLV